MVELLVAVGLIGIFSSLGLALFIGARDKAYVVRVEADLRALKSVVVLMEHDTKKWPNGCTPGAPANPLIDLSLPRAGLRQPPPAVAMGDGCAWTNEDLAAWSGPYVSATIDPWGTSYVLDPHYVPYAVCATKNELPEVAALVSFGVNRVKNDCDDLYVPVR